MIISRCNFISKCMWYENNNKKEFNP